MLQPGRKRINGDRHTRIQVMHRHLEVPSDLQKPAISAFVLPLPEEVEEYYAFTSMEDKDAWVTRCLMPMMRNEDMGCYLPMMGRVVDVYPTIYRFPEKEVDLSNV